MNLAKAIESWIEHKTSCWLCCCAFHACTDCPVGKNLIDIIKIIIEAKGTLRIDCSDYIFNLGTNIIQQSEAGW